MSPSHPQANGLAEKTVRIIKNLLTKAKLDKNNPLSTVTQVYPVCDIGSQVQLSMSRRLNFSLLCTQGHVSFIDSDKVVDEEKTGDGIGKP